MLVLFGKAADLGSEHAAIKLDEIMWDLKNEARRREGLPDLPHEGHDIVYEL